MPRFGVAGYPPAFTASPLGRDRLRILEWLHSLGLDALELQMTYGPRTSPERCRDYRNAASDFGIRLSVHASYFIVFTSDDQVKLHNSRETLKRTFELCDILGADVIVLHPGPLYGRVAADNMVERFIDNLGNCLSEINAINCSLFVETAGKIGQLGSLEEIMTICRSVPGVFPCIDFGHVHARTLGSLSSDGAVLGIFEKLANNGWFGYGKRVHFHYTPIAYGPRGELVHKTIHDRYDLPPQLDLLSSVERVAPEGMLYMPRFEPVAEGMRRWNVECTVISETHNSQEEGAMALRDSYRGK